MDISEKIEQLRERNKKLEEIELETKNEIKSNNLTIRKLERCLREAEEIMRPKEDDPEGS